MSKAEQILIKEGWYLQAYKKEQKVAMNMRVNSPQGIFPTESQGKQIRIWERFTTFTELYAFLQVKQYSRVQTFTGLYEDKQSDNIH